MAAPSRLRWVMIALVFWATVINYLDRQTLSVAAPVLREQFHMDNESYARVVSMFLFAYTISNGLSGPLIDKLGTRLGYALCMAWWSAAAILHSLATGAFSLGAFRFLLGIGEAGNWPAGVKVVAEWFPERERALAAGLFNSGSAVGAILAPPVVAWILLNLGWEWAFAGVGISGFVWLLIWWPLYHTPEAAKLEAAAARKIPVRELLRERFLWTFMIAKIFMDPVWYFYIFWFPEYLKNARGFDMKSIGTYGWIPFMVAGLGNLFGGSMSGWMLRRGVSLEVARKRSVLFFALCMTSAIPAVLTPDVRISIACVSLAMVGYTGSLANMLSFPADVYPKSVVGSIYGLASMGAGFGGMLFTLITGSVVQRYGYVPVFFMFGVMPLICASIVWTLKFERREL